VTTTGPRETPAGQAEAGPRDAQGSVVRDVVVVGASAGGVEALMRFVAALPADLPATVLVVLHMPARAPSALPAILARHGPLPTRSATPQEPLVPGRILVAPPDHHLVLAEPGLASIVRGPRENGHRPSIDVLFRTAAWHLGPRVVAVVLSGSDDDGTAGCLAVRERGGIVLAQSPEDAIYPFMPESAARTAGANAVAAAGRLGADVATAVGRSAPVPPSGGGVDPRGEDRSEDRGAGFLAKEAAVDDNDTGAVLGPPIGAPSGFVCPDCSGALFVVTEQPVLRFRCRIGHAWTADKLVAQQDMTVETALWTAVRTLQEKAELAERLAHRAHEGARPVSAHRFREAAREAHRSAGILKELLTAAPLDGGEPGELGEVGGASGT
jgi:two-component system, chemotaxis family, protein-glutamate methylesterase/glutaminase